MLWYILLVFCPIEYSIGYIPQHRWGKGGSTSINIHNVHVCWITDTYTNIISIKSIRRKQINFNCNIKKTLWKGNANRFIFFENRFRYIWMQEHLMISVPLDWLDYRQSYIDRIVMLPLYASLLSRWDLAFISLPILVAVASKSGDCPIVRRSNSLKVLVGRPDSQKVQ